jgi:hypothetical protein
MGAWNRVGIGLSYRPARLHRLAEFIRWDRFLSSINILKYGLRAHAQVSARDADPARVQASAPLRRPSVPHLHPAAGLQGDGPPPTFGYVLQHY